MAESVKTATEVTRTKIITIRSDFGRDRESSFRKINPVAEAIAKGKVVALECGNGIKLATNYFVSSGLNRFVSMNRMVGERPKPMTVIVGDIQTAREIARFSEIAELMANEFWPNRATLILPKQFSMVHAKPGSETIGVRMQDKDSFAGIILERLAGMPIATASINLLRSPNLTTRAAINHLIGKVDVIVVPDQDVDSRGNSTVLDLTESVPRLVREGSAKAREVSEFLADFDIRLAMLN